MRLVSKLLSLQEHGGSLSSLQDRLHFWAAEVMADMKTSKRKALPLQLGLVFPWWGPVNR